MMAVVTVTTVMIMAMVMTRAALMTEMNQTAKVPHVRSQFVSSNSSEVVAILSLLY